MNDEPESRADEPSPAKQSLFRTKRRLVLAVILLLVVAIAIDLGTNAVKTRREIHSSYFGVTKIDAHVQAGNLQFVASNGDSVEVDRKEKYTLRGPSITEKVQDGTLVIRQNCAGIHVGECTTSYVIAVPGNVETDATTGAGSVAADGLQAPLRITTSGGKTAISRTHGDLWVTTKTGKIASDDTSSTNVTALSQSGAIALDFAVEPSKVTAHSNDGDVSITVPKNNATYNVTAVSANKRSTVDVRVDIKSPRQITAHSENGAVSVSRG